MWTRPSTDTNGLILLVNCFTNNAASGGTNEQFCVLKSWRSASGIMYVRLRNEGTADAKIRIGYGIQTIQIT